MAAAKKGSGSSSGAGRSKAALTSAALVVAKQLSDPKVRAQIVEQGTAVADLARSWRTERRSPGSSGSLSDGTNTNTSTGPAAGGAAVGRGKQERRVQHLRTSVARLAQGRPELAGSLVPVSTTLDQIDDALDVAAGLPLTKRKKARRRIDETLDRLEETIFEASMPELP